MIQSAEEFYQLRISEKAEEYNRAAHEEATLEIWLEVIEKFPEMKEWVAHNKTVPIEILEILSHDESERVRCSVARKRKIPEKIQQRLCKDADFSVRSEIARNPKAKKNVLQILSEDSENMIKELAIKRLEVKDFE
jgi:hypothetical protein